MKQKIMILMMVLLYGVVVAQGAQPTRRQQVHGIVRDSISAEGIPYATVRAGGSTVLTDERGLFTMNVDSSVDSLTVNSQGYSQKKVALWQTSLNLYDVQLSPAATELQELVVGKQRYTKRNNPAVDFAERLRESDASTDPTQRPHYRFKRYERMVIGLNDYDANKQNALNRQCPYLAEHIDTSEITGKPVLTMAVNERASMVNYRSGVKREMVNGIRQRGVDEILEASNVETLLSDLLREVDLFDDNVILLRNSFVSPLSRLAPDCYRFYLVDTVEVSGDSCAVLAFYPRGHIGNGFVGHIYVSGDSSLNIRRVELRNRPDGSLNFIDGLNIVQTFDVSSDGSRLKTSDILALQVTMLPGTPSIYLGREITCTGHSFEPIEDETLFNMIGEVQVAEGALSRSDEFWQEQLNEPEPQGVSRVEMLLNRLRENKFFYYSEIVMKRLFSGYWPIGHESKIEFGPWNTLVSYNALEGVRLKAGGITTANLSPHWFGRGFVAYGCRDKRWKYMGEVEYSFNRKDYHSREFPIHSIKLKHSYDLDRIGTEYPFTNADNFVLSLTRMPARMDTYRRDTQLEYTLELRNNFSLKAGIEHIRQEPSAYVPLTTVCGTELNHYDQTVLDIELRYAPGERFYQLRSGRVPVNFDAPTFTLRQRFSTKGLFRSRYTLNRTELSFSKRFWLSVAGKLDVAVSAGHVWSSTPFPELFIPNANLSYTIQPQSFALMTPMEFMNTTYGSLFLVYHLEGLILKHIPIVRDAGLREVVGFSALWGKRSNSCEPNASHPELLRFPVDAPARSMDKGPYMEISAGLDNILRYVRAEYYWRLTYRDASYPIDRSGLRVALHFTF